jgi:hypothetical protein
MQGWKKRDAVLAVMTVGLITWCLTNWIVHNDPLLIVHQWSWPAESYAGYGSGPIYFYAVAFFLYCGLPLSVLFCLGVLRPARFSMGLCWAVWGAVIGAHSIMYWGGWFASCGVIRILACTATITAIICLQGWNNLSHYAETRWKRVRLPRGWVCGIAVAVIAAYPAAQYVVETGHWEGNVMQHCTAYLRQNKLLSPDVRFFQGNNIVATDLENDLRRQNILPLPVDSVKVRRLLRELPVGSIGVWDNQQAPDWHGITIEQLSGEGFTVLYEKKLNCWWTFSWRNRKLVHYAVLKKTGEGPRLEVPPEAKN